MCGVRSTARRHRRATSGAARAVAVVVGGEVVSDPDQPRPQRPPVGLAQRALEVPVGLQERLLGEVLGVVVVADPVVGVAVDVAQMRAVELGEVRVEPALSASSSTSRSSLLTAVSQPRQAALSSRSPRSPSTSPPEPRAAAVGAPISGPPSQSHCSSTHGQMRAVTSRGQVGRRVVDLREAQRTARSGCVTLCGRIRQPRRTRLGAGDRDRHDGRAGLQRQPPDAAARLVQRARRGGACPRGRSRRSRRARGSRSAVSIASLVGLAALDRERAEAVQQPAAANGLSNSSFFATK